MHRSGCAVVGLVAVLGIAPGSAAAAGSAARTAPRVVTAPTASNQTVHLRVGQRLAVNLEASYRTPTSSRRAVVARTHAVGGYPTNQPVHAIFKAMKAGRASVRSETDYACLHATPPCEIAQQEWVVNLVVAPAH